MGPVLVCGNAVLDILVRPVRDPLRWGETTIVDRIEQHMGGNGSSTSFALGKLGVPVKLITTIGRDAAADFVLQRLRSANVDTSLVQLRDAPTSTALSLVDASGQRALLYQLGATAEDFDEPLPLHGSHFHLAAVYRMQYLRTHAPRLLRQAKAAGLTTSIDTQWDHQDEWLSVLAPSLPWCDLLFVNEDELRLLTGSRGAEMLRDLGAKSVVVKLGPRGCLVEKELVPAFQIPAVDTTGAGDCFTGGWLAAKHWGWGLWECARFANAIGALSVQALGATEGLELIR